LAELSQIKPKGKIMNIIAKVTERVGPVVVFLLGGGDADGFYIGRDGKIHPIEPYGPAVSSIFKSIPTLVRTQSHLPQLKNNRALDGREIDSLHTKLSGLAVAEVEARVGKLDENSSIILMDGTDIFAYGSGGKVFLPVRLDSSSAIKTA
jgi:hypothetical protein